MLLLYSEVIVLSSTFELLSCLREVPQNRFFSMGFAVSVSAESFQLTVGGQEYGQNADSVRTVYGQCTDRLPRRKISQQNPKTPLYFTSKLIKIEVSTNREAKWIMNKEKDSIASYLSKVVSGDACSAQKQTVEVKIAGNTFHISAKEPKEYIRSVAGYVDHKIASVSGDGKLSLSDSAILACCNIADEQFKCQENMKELRLQLKAYLDDIARLRTEVNELRSELKKANKE